MLKLQIPVNSRGELFEFALSTEKVTIGRRHDNDVRIKERYISAYHAEFFREPNGMVFIRDQDSSNGTFLNGSRVTEPVIVKKGDLLKFGSLQCRIEDAKVSSPAVVSDPGQDFAIQVAAKSVDAPKQILADQNDGRWQSNVQSNGPRIVAIIPDSSDEVERLKKELDQNKLELNRAKEALEKIAVQMALMQQKKADEDAVKLKKISELEDQVRNRDEVNETLDHQLQLATNRLEQIEDELLKHKTELSSEIKAAMQRLSSTKNDNVLLKGTLEALEAERNKHRDLAVNLFRKLEQTREGFSSVIHIKNHSLQKSGQIQSEMEAQHEAALFRLNQLEEELSSLRCEFTEMESDYRDRLVRTSAALEKSKHGERQLVEDLKLANEELKKQKAVFVKLDAAFQAVEAEKQAAEDDWKARYFELNRVNEKLLVQSGDIKTLESILSDTTSQVKKLSLDKSVLEKETRDLKREKESLVAETRKVSEERQLSVASISQVREESLKASSKLDLILQRLDESEKKVSYLRNLEAELEKSVLRAQRSALSRKGIYREDDEEQNAIWSEAEQLICRELIERMELLEDLLRRYQQNWLFPKVAEQLNLLRDSFMVLLKNHSVDRFDLEPGTELSVDSRKKIQLISVDDVEDPKLKKLSLVQAGDGKRTRVLQTLRPGYIYSKGGLDVIIRKAEVIVA